MQPASLLECGLGRLPYAEGLVQRWRQLHPCWEPVVQKVAEARVQLLVLRSSDASSHKTGKVQLDRSILGLNICKGDSFITIERREAARLEFPEPPELSKYDLQVISGVGLGHVASNLSDEVHPVGSQQGLGRPRRSPNESWVPHRPAAISASQL